MFLSGCNSYLLRPYLAIVGGIMTLTLPQQRHIAEALRYIAVSRLCRDYNVNYGDFYRWINGGNSQSHDNYVLLLQELFNLNINNLPNLPVRRLPVYNHKKGVSNV